MKKTSRSQSDILFVVMNALVHVLVNEVFVPHCHLNGDCQESRSRVSFGLFQPADDCHSERSRVSSELIQSVGGCQSERSRVWSELVQSAGICQSEQSRVWSELVQSADICQPERLRVCSELHCCQEEDEDEVQVTGCCNDQDDGCHSASFHSSSPFLVFFLTSSILSSLAFHFSDVLERKF